MSAVACLLDPVGCTLGAIGAWFASVPWYGWALLAAIVVGIVWKLAGWPGLLALVAGAGFILGRRSTDDPTETEGLARDPKPVRRGQKKVRTIFDTLRRK